MRTTKKTTATCAISALLALATLGCAQKTTEKPNWSIQPIAELSTTECYYHNVARLSHEAGNFTGYGYKKMWIEYSGTVRMGIDAGKVNISLPDSNGNVVVTIPEATVLGEPDVDETSITEPLIETGLFTTITSEEKAQMFADAQKNMREAAENDSALLYQARERAKEIFEQYVKNVGETMGKTYTVEFKDAD